MVLGPRGRIIIQSAGGDVVSPPHINQIDHDEIVARIALAIMALPFVRVVETDEEAAMIQEWIRLRIPRENDPGV